MRYFSQGEDATRHMLSALGKKNIEELFSSIPAQSQLKRPLNLPKSLNELELKRELAKYLSPPDHLSFLGAGATQHFVPEWVSQQLLRAEWYTAYTPYQPEVSQGTLQAIFEFQSIVASLFGLEVANASMYDAATALVEAVLMAVRIKRQPKVLATTSLHPEYIETLKTYLAPANIELCLINNNENGTCDLKQLEKYLESDEKFSALLIQSPNFFGRLEEFSRMASLAHEKNMLVVGAVSDISALGICESFGSMGADIAVGDGIGFVGPISLGGPGVGLFACKKALLRQMPGRLAGYTEDQQGRPGFALTLSTREQHIRREKATSNICSNHNLMAMALTMTLSSYGKRGFVELAKKNLKKTMYFRKLLAKNNLKEKFPGAHFNETVLEFSNEEVFKNLLTLCEKEKIIPGVRLEKFFPKLKNCLQICITELHSDQQIEKLVEILAGASHGK